MEISTIPSARLPGKEEDIVYSCKKLQVKMSISYVIMQGDPENNLDVFEKIVRYMYENDMGYFSISHHVDRCPVCGYTGSIKDECPQCHFRETDKHIDLGIVQRHCCG